ncbi:MAG: hypothetical protein HON05_03020 [Euryarchaeota archaeon]|nr:hypothetical protein [Euryarchaeota archaeon]MBT5025717.1 hypothetical protein [Euryarchaeota archaeon]MBT6255531.1 hypothetical protein [Euryarchaeota archaeon]MBT6526966.1 hypothetical protein [Euryarchaeota archaeon]MBT7961973.1 hypothetical protein [Euryarchaeota archaeon]
METSARWQGRLDALGSKERETLLGTSLSRRFTRLPLWLSHPSNISAFYGFLVSLALILPYRFAQESDSWLTNWIFHSALIMVACLLLGMLSLIIIRFTKRFPVTPPRYILYPMPFIGLALLTISLTEMLELPSSLIWLLLLLPGPMYVHLSWAPRWRLLCQLEDNQNPFEGLESNYNEQLNDAEEIADGDEELLSVVNALEDE